jgi:hypothetical protein
MQIDEHLRGVRSFRHDVGNEPANGAPHFCGAIQPLGRIEQIDAIGQGEFVVPDERYIGEDLSVVPRDDLLRRDP